MASANSTDARTARKTQEWIRKARAKHGDRYDYSGTVYVHSMENLRIRCRKCNEVFFQRPCSHLEGYGCKTCGRQRAARKVAQKRRLSLSQFINRCRDIHGDTYGYQCVEYVNTGTKVAIRCKKHGVFEQTPENHIQGQGCPTCAAKTRNNNRNEKCRRDFVSRCVDVHGGTYDYSRTVYRTSNQKVVIVCREHGLFRQFPADHLNGSGCPGCQDSKGEKRIADFLDANNVSFRRQATFAWCVDVGRLRFDFRIKRVKLLIEFDGEQHFSRDGKLVFFDRTSSLDDQQRRDRIKDESCAREGWDLVRIPYTEINNIEDILRPALRRHGFFV